MALADHSGPVCVEWQDSALEHGWVSYSREEGQPAKLNCETAGYLMSEDDDRVVIAQSLSANGHAQNLLTIPRGAIVAIWHLRGGVLAGAA